MKRNVTVVAAAQKETVIVSTVGEMDVQYVIIQAFVLPATQMARCIETNLVFGQRSAMLVMVRAFSASGVKMAFWDVKPAAEKAM